MAPSPAARLSSSGAPAVSRSRAWLSNFPQAAVGLLCCVMVKLFWDLVKCDELPPLQADNERMIGE